MKALPRPNTRHQKISKVPFFGAFTLILWLHLFWAASAFGQVQDLTAPAFEDASDVKRAERNAVEEWMRCDDNARGDAELDALQRTLDAQSAREMEELEEAFKHARRAARLPEVIRFQAGGRYDRDQQNRKRLTENYDDYGDIERSALENRDTFRDDMYVNLNLTAEWRLTQTRWSRDEMSLRREKTALHKAQQKRAQDATHHWFALHNARLAWCDLYSPDDPYAEAPSPTPRQRERARLKIWEALSILNTLTHGWFLFHAGDEPDDLSDAHLAPSPAAAPASAPSSSDRLEVRDPRKKTTSPAAASSDQSTARRSPRVAPVAIVR